MELYGLFGAGGFGREIMPLVRDMLIIGRQSSVGHELVFVVEGLDKEYNANGYRVISDESFFSLEGKKYFNIAIASSNARERIAQKAISNGAEPFNILSSTATLLDENNIGQGAILCGYTTITSNAKIGKFFHANLYSYVAHDCIIGDYVTFAPHVHCNGRVIVEDHVYIGTGAIIRDATDAPIVIGRNSVVGMGAVVTKSVKPFTTVIGSPAVELKNKV